MDYAHPDKAEGETKGSVITPQNTPSVGKDSKQSATKQEKSDETAKKEAVSEDLFTMAERVAAEDKAKRIRKKEEAKVDTNPIESSERTKPETKNRLVTDERYEELKKRMRAKLRGQLNLGVAPEMLAIGAEMAVYHI